jgi:hypothetical protein
VSYPADPNPHEETPLPPGCTRAAFGSYPAFYTTYKDPIRTRAEGWADIYTWFFAQKAIDPSIYIVGWIEYPYLADTTWTVVELSVNTTICPP